MNAIIWRCPVNPDNDDIHLKPKNCFDEPSIPKSEEKTIRGILKIGIENA